MIDYHFGLEADMFANTIKAFVLCKRMIWRRACFQLWQQVNQPSRHHIPALTSFSKCQCAHFWWCEQEQPAQLHMFGCLVTREWNSWVGLEDVALLKEVCNWQWGALIMSRPNHSLSPPAGQDGALSSWSRITCAPTIIIMDWTSETVSEPSVKCFL